MELKEQEFEKCMVPWEEVSLLYKNQSYTILAWDFLSFSRVIARLISLCVKWASNCDCVRVK